MIKSAKREHIAFYRKAISELLRNVENDSDLMDCPEWSFVKMLLSEAVCKLEKLENETI